jgi:hypothetical protein
MEPKETHMRVERNMTAVISALALTMAGVLGTSACSSSSSNSNDGGTGATGGGGGTGGTPDGGTFALKPFTAPPMDPGAKAVLFTASGEELAFSGYAFPPAMDGDPAFVDGWQIDFDHLLVTIDKITLSENPVKVPTDQAQTGTVVAEVDGPFAVDLHPKGPLMGKGGGDETAVPIAALTNQNKNGNKAFDTGNGTPYAFGFDLAAATANAQNVNLDADALTAYQKMVTGGCAVLYMGTATFNGGADCSPADPEFAKLPATVKFSFCFKSPTTYVNCQDGSNDAAGINGEEHPRGFAFKDNEAVIAQVTVHTDHPFWESLVHDSPAHFDQFAAQAVGASGTPTVTLDDVVGLDFTAMTDKAQTALPWRTCLPKTKYPMGGYDAPAGQMAFDPKPYAKNADPTKGFRDYHDYTTYNQSTQGHLNSDGLCAINRHYPSPL